MVQRKFDKLKGIFQKFGTGKEVFGFGGVLFSRLIYLWFLIIGLVCLPILNEAFGPESYTYRTAFDAGLRENIIYFLTYNPEYYIEVYVLFLVCGLLCLVNVGGFLVRGVFWLSAMVLSMSSHIIFNASMLLACNWAFLLIFYFPRLDRDWKIMVSNLSVLALRTQFLIVYFFAAAYKWMISDWLVGDSVHYLSMIDHYTPSWVFSALQWQPFSMVLLNYFVLLYLTLFPVLVWYKKAKTPLMLVGAGFHLYTMFIMDLYDFGAIMLIGYLLFLSKEQVEKIERVMSWSKLTKILRLEK